MLLTSEQAAFVEHPTIRNCKLISVPGSGKTTCIVARARYIKRNLTPDRLLILCFQRFVADSIRSYMTTDDDRIDIFTIDALARKALVEFCPQNSKEVRCFSSHFHDLLLDTVSTTTAALVSCIGRYSCIFVDEAQDLNELQYQLVLHLAKRLEACLVLIGDPNQTIYHFRGASPRHLLQYDADRFTLSQNFRSCPTIVELGNAIGRTCLAEFHCVDAHSTKPVIKDAVRVVHGSPYDLLNRLADRLERCATDGMDLSEVCITAPTRGQSDAYPNIGCAQVSNYLRLRGIKTSRFYSECGDAPSVQPYAPVPGRVNVMTVCAAKGLQWRLVILVTPHQQWFNTLPTKSDHEQHAHQIFVAATRPQERLLILTAPHCLNTAFSVLHTVPHVVENAVANDPPATLDELLASSTPLENEEDERQYKRCHVTQIVGNATPDTMKFFSQSVIQKEHVHHMSRPFKDPGMQCDAAFLGMLAEKVFVKEVSHHRGMVAPAISCIETWYAKDMVVCPSQHVLIASRILRRGSTDLPLDMPQSVREGLLSKRGNVPVDRITHSLVAPHAPTIVRAYKTYKSLNVTPEKCMNSLFLVTLALYAFNTRHFMYVRGGGGEKRHVLECKQVLDNARSMGHTLAHSDDKPMAFSRRDKLFTRRDDVVYILHGEIDLVHGGVAVEIKATHSTTLDHALQVYLYAKMLKPVPRTARVLNVLTGTVTTYTYPEDRTIHDQLLERLLRDSC